MKKNGILPVALCCALMFSACGGEAAGASAPAATAIPPETSAAQPATEGASSESFALSEELLALLKGDNAALKQLRQGDCYGEITGRGTARVLYFDPFLDVQMIPPEEGNEAAWREGYGEGHQTENPFVNELPVLEVTVEDAIDPLAPAVSAQDSLRQLFKTDERITYELLCEGMSQTPELTHSKTVYYTAPVRENWPLGSDPGRQIEGGEWRADFSVHGLRLTVGFVREDGEYVAWRATLSEE